jgi:hypothetical protein
MMRRLSRVFLLPVLMLPSCAIPNTLEMLADHSPPPEFGRPAWVRTCAGVGGWLGAIIGGVASVATLPITYPLSLAADEGLGEHSSDELLLAPAVGMSAVGHCLLGLPADLIDWTFYRAWVAPNDPVTDYDWTPLDPVVMPKAPTDPTGG